jgi:glutathione S-transferase
MKLYFSPLACSLATRIVLYEAGAAAEFEEVHPHTKRTSAGRDLREVHPLGLVPVLELDDGRLVTENAAVLQYLARRFPDARLSPLDEDGVTELQRWLCFIGTELHKAMFMPLLAKSAGPDAKSYALALSESRLGYLNQHLSGREFLLERFSVADAYLFTILNWTQATPVALEPWPALSGYLSRLRKRPAVARAYAEELELYRLETPRAASEPSGTAATLERFNAAFLRHEASLLDDLVAPECFIENTTPAPHGALYQGRAACLALWRGIAENRGAHFELEDQQISGEFGTIRWRYVWGSSESESVRGVNLMRVRDGLIVEARGYVKGA